MSKTVTIKITEDGRALEERLKRFNGLQVEVGYHHGNGEHDGVDLCDIVAFNEFGTSRIPSRPFMRQTYDKRKAEIVKFNVSEVIEVIKGAEPEKAAESIGVFIKGCVQEEIVNGEFVPNAPSTIARKHSSKPLIDTGLMRQSVSAVVTKKEGQ